MAQTNKKKNKRASDYNDLLNLYSNRNTIDTASDAKDEASDMVSNDGNVNNISSVLRQQQGQPFGRPNSIDDPSIAPLDSSDDRGRSITSTLNGGGSLDGLGKTNIPRASLDVRQMRPGTPQVPESSLPNFAQGEYSYSPSTTPMYGGINNIPPIKTLLAPEEEGAASHYSNIIAAAVNKAPGVDATFAPGTPEAKLTAALANTNPAPRSFWRRLGASFAEGAARVKPGDSPGSMLGNIIGSVVPGLIPGVDSYKQAEENKRKALEDYQIESAARKNAQQYKESEADIEYKRATANLQNNNARVLNQTRLDNVTKGRADQIMTALSKLPENDPQRDALAKVLGSPPYSIDVGRNYGLLSKEEKEVTAGAKLQQQNNKPLTESDLRRKAEATVKGSYNWEEKARSSTDARMDQIKANIRDQEFGGNVSSSKRDDYNKRVQQEYNRILQSNKDYSKAEYEKQVSAEIDRLRGQQPSPAATTSTKRTRGKVPASNAASNTNFSGVTIRLPGVTK